MKIEIVKILDETTRQQALQVIEAVYFKDKKWIRSVENEIPANIADEQRFSWFLATVNDKPAGVLRLCYDPPLEFPPDFEATFRSDINLKEIAATCRFVEIGRFMILPRYRKNIFVALRLMRMAIAEVVSRDYTHFLTDVFKGEINSPLKFHTRVLGFEIIGTHLHGELNCNLTRVILTLDILKAYQRLKKNRSRIYQILTEGIRERLDRKLAASQNEITAKAAGQV
jgi:hypothetical protein